MITISKNLIIPADQEENRKKLTAAINKKKTSDRTIFCVILPTTDGGILEVIPAFALRLEAKDHDITVVGACEGRKNAMALVEQMIGELYEKTGGFDAKSYYLQ
ncbi:MAG: hypothetical protein J5738_07620 [Lachnospiraceae bacterium]|nr:hypothetical protein [Lachnospiraceae bacterium]